jgi:Icc-related predicted phosphoesterase
MRHQSGSHDKLKIAAVGDIHCTRTSHGKLQPLFTAMSDSADCILLCGDLTDLGLPEEAHILVDELSGIRHKPIIGVLGNHDFESGKQEEVARILSEGGVLLLDGGTAEVNGVGFAGVKGFAGGFGRRILEPFGEEAIKNFVREGVDEALKLESALARLRTPQRIAVLHYSPIQATVEGEPPEIYPFLGSSRLEEPLIRYPVGAVFHGHAHYGRAEGRMSNGTPVYNVAMALLRRDFGSKPPFRILEVPIHAFVHTAK